jgi:hypothetical protein
MLPCVRRRKSLAPTAVCATERVLADARDGAVCDVGDGGGTELEC